MVSSEPKVSESPKVLIITYYWPPSGGAGVQRFLKFAKYLPQHGVEPVILTCANPTYPIQDPSLAGDIPEELDVHFARTIEPFGFYSWLTGTSPEKAANPTAILGTKDLSLPQRMVRYLRANLFVPDARIGWVPFARSKARSLIRQYQIDTVITTGPPHSTHFIGRGLKRKTGVRWVADFRDPWTDIHYNRALPRNRVTKMCDARFEASVLAEADEVTVTAPGTATYFSRKVNRSYHTIPNGYDPDDFETGISNPGKTSDKNRPFVIRHIGSITETSVPDNLLKVISGYPDDKIRMEFIGLVHPGVQKKVNDLGLKNKVELKPYVPHKKATSLMQQADMNVVVVHRSDDSRILIPGKLYDYLKAGKPVMVIGPPDGDAAAIVRKCGIGEAFDYEDIAGPKAWISALLKNGRDKISPSENEISRYSRSFLTARLAGILFPENK